jgi:DNA-binding PadR family transcriptional regulator
LNGDKHEIEARLRAALRDEAGELWPPATLWPRIRAGLAQPREGRPALTRPRAELRALLRRGDLRGLTLALLAEREMDAFTLARRVEDVARGAGLMTPPEGALLPIVHGLESAGLVAARWQQSPRGLRRAYTLSVRGRRVRRRAGLSWLLTTLGARLGRLAAGRLHHARPAEEC